MIANNIIANKVYIGEQKYKWVNQFAKTAEWKAIESYADTNSYALPTNIDAFDELIKDLKSAGIWSKLDVFYVFAGDGSNGFKLINWKNPNQHYATAYGGLTWDLDGVKGNGSNAYINTNYTSSVDSVNRKLSDASIFGVMSQSGDRLWGAETSIKDFLNNSGGEKQLDGNFINFNATHSSGFVGIMRYGTTSGSYIRSADEFALSGGTNSLTNEKNTLFMTRGNLYGTAGLSCWATGGSLTYAETQSFRTIYNNFLTSLGLTPIA